MTHYRSYKRATLLLRDIINNNRSYGRATLLLRDTLQILLKSNIVGTWKYETYSMVKLVTIKELIKL